MFASDSQTAVCSTSDPELWFSDRKRDKAAARELCMTCPLLADCRELGKTQEYGIWGGVDAEVHGAVEERALRLAQRRENVLALHAEGLSYAEIGRRLDVAPASVRFIALDLAA